MNARRVWMALPYAVLLALAAWFYKLAAAIDYPHRGGNLGPDFWPRVVLAAMMIICVVQGARLLLFGRADDAALIDTGMEKDQGPRSHAMLAAGVALTIAFGALVTTLGFMITTFLFMVLFMYAGGYRSHPAIWLSSLIGVVVLAILFQKAVYVSLPRGVPPFDRVGDAVLAMVPPLDQVGRILRAFF